MLTFIRKNVMHAKKFREFGQFMKFGQFSKIRRTWNFDFCSKSIFNLSVPCLYWDTHIATLVYLFMRTNTLLAHYYMYIKLTFLHPSLNANVQHLAAKQLSFLIAFLFTLWQLQKSTRLSVPWILKIPLIRTKETHWKTANF